MEVDRLETLIRSERRIIEKRLDYLEALLMEKKATDDTIEALQDIAATGKKNYGVVTFD